MSDPGGRYGPLASMGAIAEFLGKSDEDEDGGIITDPPAAPPPSSALFCWSSSTCERATNGWEEEPASKKKKNFDWIFILHVQKMKKKLKKIMKYIKFNQKIPISFKKKPTYTPLLASIRTRAQAGGGGQNTKANFFNEIRSPVNLV